MTDTVTLPVFNLNRAREAAKDEAADRPWMFEFNDHLYELLPAKRWPLSVSDKLSAGEIGPAMRMLLVGDGEYQRLVDDGAEMGDLELIMEAYAAENNLESAKNS